MSVTHNFTIEQGSDFKITFFYQDADGSPIDISEGKVGFRFQAVDPGTGQLDASEPVIEFLRGQPNGYVRSGGIGEIIVELPAVYTKDLTFDNYFYDLDFEPTVSDGVTLNTRISTGTISLIKKNFNTFLDVAPVDDSDSGGTPGNVVPIDMNLDGDRCTSAVACLDLDIYSRVYNGDSIIIEDNTNNSGTISGVTSRQTMQKIEVSINGLKHENPQDLTFILEPPSGDMVLLSSNNKISNYNPSTDTNGFSWVFSNSAPSDTFLNTVQHNSACRIDDKTDIVKYSSNNLRSDFDHLLFQGPDHHITGAFTLYANDNDRIGSGVITNWNLIITYTGVI